MSIKQTYPGQVLRPEGKGTAILVCDHASNFIPPEAGNLGLEEAERNRHIGWDIGAEGVTQRLSELLDAPAVLAETSRLYVDLNRNPYDGATAMPPLADGTVVPGNQDLSLEQVEYRIRQCYWPYHHTISKLSGTVKSRLEAKQKKLSYISVHSFTPEFQGHKRPWEIGVLYASNETFGRRLIEKLKANHPELTVGENEPYTSKSLSNMSMIMHGDAQGIDYVVLELRQDLIATQEGQAHWAQLLAPLLEEIIEE